MRVIEATERGRISLPIDEVIGDGGVFNFLEETKGRGYFDVDFRKGELLLVAGNYIGQIPLTADIAVHVKPKVNLSNLARVVGIANQPVRCLQSYIRKYEISASASATLTEAIAESLARSLREVHREGLYRQYVRRVDSLNSPRGRPLIGRYIRQGLARGKAMAVPCSYHVLTADTGYNQLIKRAISVIGHSLAEGQTTKAALIRELEFFYDLFDSVSFRDDSRLLEQVRLELLRSRLPALREYYAQVLDISFVILEGNGVELTGVSGQRSMHSLIVNLEDAFESYILNVIRNSPTLAMSGLHVKDGNKEGKQPLFGDSDVYDAKPDYVIGNDTSALLLGDAKYKTKLLESDRYQLITHALSYGVRGCFFVTPSQDDMLGAHRVGEVGNSGLVVHHYHFNLDALDLAAEEECFVDWLVEVARDVCDAE